MEIETVVSIKRMCREFSNMFNQFVMYNEFGPGQSKPLSKGHYIKIDKIQI